MKKALALLLISLFFAGCGINRGYYNPETKEVYFWLGKEYDEFILIYENGEESLTIYGSEVRAFKGQKINAEMLKSALEGLVKGLKVP